MKTYFFIFSLSLFYFISHSNGNTTDFLTMFIHWSLGWAFGDLIFFLMKNNNNKR